jgi:hypothetical protein
MVSAETQREFLKMALEDRLPVIYTDGAATHVCYLTQVRFGPEFRGHPEGDTATLVLVEAQPTTWGGLAWEEQLQFLREVGQETQPALYYDKYGAHLVYVTQVSLSVPYRGARGEEPVVQLRMIELKGPALYPRYDYADYVFANYL